MKNTLITVALGLSLSVSPGALASARGDSESSFCDWSQAGRVGLYGNCACSDEGGCIWIDQNPNPPVIIPMETCDYTTDHTKATGGGAECECSDEGGCSWILTDVHARAQ